MRTSLRILPGLILLSGIISCNSSVSSRESACAIGDAVATDGMRRLALIVGVGDYADESIPDLSGTLVDAQRMYDLLTGSYGFPKENVCLLLDDDATMQKFRAAFNDGLVERATDDDVAVIFFAGHGSQVPDRNGDEPDEWDETFAFHESDGWGAGELVDDEFHTMLQSLHAKTHNIVTIIDSCNSGSATRGDSGLQARFLPRATRPLDSVAEDAGPGDGGGSWTPDALPGLIALTAASDGTPALETAKSGIFTDALIQVLSRPRSGQLTYAQLARQVPPLVSANSYQIPYFQGDLGRPVFGLQGAARPHGWEVIQAEPLELGGPPLTGVSKGAEFRIFDGALIAADLGDPAKAKATVEVTKATGLNARARVSAKPSGAASIEAGDIALLVRVGDDTTRIRVGVRHPQRAGGVPAARATALREMIARNPEAAALVELVDSGDQFELSMGTHDRLMLRGPENRIRNVYDNDAVIPRSLWQHARQRALLLLSGEGGNDFSDHETLRVQLVEAASQPACADGEWAQAEPHEEQLVPLCHHFQIKVALSETSPHPLSVGGVVLSTDGSTFGFPTDGRTEVLEPGQELTFAADRETFQGRVPLDVQDHILVFGSQLSNPVPWHLMTQSAATRSKGIPASSPLAKALHNYLAPGTRGVRQAAEIVEDTTWTLSSVALRVRANQTFKPPSTADAAPGIREYTLRNFDIRPYLPDDPDTAIHGVLQQADWLAGASRKEGFSYKQHDWSQPSREENLAVGIDCSRAIWYAFTHAGIEYNRDNRYLATAQMVADDTLMSDEFEQCPTNDDLQLGDILVYRSDERNDGHVVMVIDPGKRIAWGSHGWDGNAKESDYAIEPDTGVEYQRIKYKQDWQRWDRQDMEMKRCWRHRIFSSEREHGSGVPGIDALGRVCNDLRCQL